MYILLNVKDGSRVSDVIQLLFKNGYSSLNVGEKITDLCPQCSTDNKGKLEEELEDKCIPRIETPPRATAHITPRASSSASETRCTSTSDREPLKLPVKVVNYVTVSHSSTIPKRVPEPAPAPSQWVDDMLCAPKEEEREDSESPIILEEDHPPLRTFPEILEANANPADYTSVRRRKGNNAAPCDGYVCQMCRSVISNNGPNLMNQLERHARLHASQKQFSCSLCNHSFTRRYLTADHIKQTHKENIQDAVIIDHVRELRHEYEALVGKCFFPGMELSRAQFQAYVENVESSAKRARLSNENSG